MSSTCRPVAQNTATTWAELTDRCAICFIAGGETVASGRTGSRLTAVASGCTPESDDPPRTRSQRGLGGRFHTGWPHAGVIRRRWPHQTLGCGDVGRASRAARPRRTGRLDFFCPGRAHPGQRKLRSQKACHPLGPRNQSTEVCPTRPHRLCPRCGLQSRWLLCGLRERRSYGHALGHEETADASANSTGQAESIA